MLRFAPDYPSPPYLNKQGTIDLPSGINSTTNREGYREYKSDTKICEHCPHLNQCTLSQTHVKVVTRHVWQDAVKEERDTAFITFSSGKTAIYDFAPLQYRSFIRSRHLSIRGTKGEWSDRIVYYTDSRNRPQRTFLMPEIEEGCRDLDTQGLRDLRKVWAPELFLDTEQDEFAIASVLLDMGSFVQGGPSP